MSALIAPFAHAVGGLLVLKTCFLFLATAVLVWTMPRVSAAARHLVISVALAGGLVLPALALVIPAWHVLPYSDQAPAPGAAASELTAPAPVPAGTAVGSRPPPDPRPRGAADAPGSASHVLANESSGARPTVPWRRVLGGLWTAGATALLLLLGLRILVMRRVVRRSTAVRDPAWTALVTELCARQGVARPVELRRSHARTMPLVWGFRRPVMLLPSSSASWTASRRRAVLAHELAHVARYDMATLMLGHVVCAVYWFNPLVWWLTGRAALERERACDDAVLDLGVGPAQYAEHVLEVAAAHRLVPGLAPVMAARSQLEGRIVAILNPQLNRRTVRRTASTAIAVTVIAVLVPLSSMATARAPQGVTAADRQLTQSDSDTQRFRAHLASLEMDRRDVAALVAGLASDDPLTRGACAWALGQTGDERAVDPLIAAVADRDATVREWAVRSLGQVRARRSVDPLVGRLDDPRAPVREWAARSLADIGDRRAVQPLIDRLDDSSSAVREWIVRALGELGDARAIEPLSQLDDPSPTVRTWAMRAIRRLRARAVPGRTVDTAPSAGDARGRGDRPEEPSLPALVDRLRDESPSVRAGAARALGDFGNRYGWVRPAEEPLIPVPDDANRTVLRRADPRAVEPLMRALGDGSASVREWAARSLGAFEDARSVEPLVDRLSDGSGGVREWAARSLGTIGDTRAVQSLIDGVGDQRGGTREWFLRALGSLGDPRAARTFSEALEHESPTIREWAARGLGALRVPESFDPLVAHLDDDNATVRQWTTRALGALGDPRAAAHVERMLADENAQVRYWAGRALANLPRD